MNVWFKTLRILRRNWYSAQAEEWILYDGCGNQSIDYTMSFEHVLIQNMNLKYCTHEKKDS